MLHFFLIVDSKVNGEDCRQVAMLVYSDWNVEFGYIPNFLLFSP